MCVVVFDEMNLSHLYGEFDLIASVSMVYQEDLESAEDFQ